MADPNLSQRAEGLTTAVAELSTAVGRLATNQTRMRHVIYATIAGVMLDLVLTVVVSVLFSNQREVSNQISEANSRIETVQRRTSDEVLCPLYKVLLSFEPRASTSPTITPEERQARVEAYDVVRQGYVVLGCD